MCGLFCLIKKKKFNFNKEQLSKTKSFLNHRGPDDFNTLVHENIFISHSRLEIIDKDNGKQPMKEELLDGMEDRRKFNAKDPPPY